MSRLSYRISATSSDIENINTSENVFGSDNKSTAGLVTFSPSKAVNVTMESWSTRLSDGRVLSEKQHVVATEQNGSKPPHENISSMDIIKPDRKNMETKKGGGAGVNKRSNRMKKTNMISDNKSVDCSSELSEALPFQTVGNGSHGTGETDINFCSESVSVEAASSNIALAAKAAGTNTSVTEDSKVANNDIDNTETVINSITAACVESVGAINITATELNVSTKKLGSPHSIVHPNPRAACCTGKSSANKAANASTVGKKANNATDNTVVIATNKKYCMPLAKSKSKTVPSKNSASTSKAAASTNKAADTSNAVTSKSKIAFAGNAAAAGKSAVSVVNKLSVGATSKLTAERKAVVSESKAATVNNASASESTVLACAGQATEGIAASALSKAIALDNATVNAAESETTAASAASKAEVHKATDVHKAAVVAPSKTISISKLSNSIDKSATSTSTIPATTSTRKTSVKSSRRQIGPVPGTFGSPSLARLMTDFYPVRRSSRATTSQIKKREQDRLEEFVLSQCEAGLKVVQFPEKGRGVVTTRAFSRGEYLVEYAGELVEFSVAKQREAVYSQDQRLGCYMYYFTHRDKRFCIDATQETPRLGRLINHSRLKSNCATKIFEMGGRPRLIFVALKQIEVGEELLYDYGDRDPLTMETHPWLAY